MVHLWFVFVCFPDDLACAILLEINKDLETYREA